MDENRFDCKLDIPYPPVKTEAKNLFYATLLTNDYAGVVSETSAVMAYLFQHFVTAENRIADAVRCISIVEMRHLGYIGELIELLGGNPRFSVQSGCKCTYWNAQFISYEANPKHYLKENIANEKAAIANYNMRINQISDKYVQAVLERIILDEEHHIRIFNELLESL